MTRLKRATEILLHELVDYAGLFPPAALGMTKAVHHYADDLAGPWKWMLGRFIVPVARLDEFEEAASPLLPRNAGAAPWRLSVLAGTGPADDAARIERFNDRFAAAGSAVIDTLEVRGDDAAGIEQAVRRARPGLTTYVEIPIGTDPGEPLRMIAAAGLRAKVRTGGVTPDAFPEPASLARFIRRATDALVPFKATAGLHHPLRGEYRLTYDSSSALGTMYGFLNVFLAAAFAAHGLGESDLEEMLTERDPSAVRFDDDAVTWRGHRLGIDDLRRTRARGAIAFGSCSFDEPVTDLQRLHLLETQ